MDPTVLVTAASTGLIEALTTQTWEQARTAMVGLWRRVHPNRAEAISEELAEVRREAIAAQQRGELAVRHELIVDWRGRLRRLLDADPSSAIELKRILDEVITPMLSAEGSSMINNIVMNAHATGRSIVYQAGRDVNINDSIS